MKSLSITLLFAALLANNTGNAQTAIPVDSVMITERPSANTQLFRSLSIEAEQLKCLLNFEVAAVKNVRTYRIEAGNSPTSMEIVGQIDKPINSMLARKFNFELVAAEQDYKYYRVVQVSMDHSWTYSPTVEK